MATKAPSTTAKKRTTTKTTKTTSASRAKKPVAKKTASQKQSTKKPEYTSFKLSNDKQQFMSFSVTKQTIYWAVLGVLAILFCWFTITMAQQIDDIYAQIDEIRLNDTEIVTPIVESSEDTNE